MSIVIATVAMLGAKPDVVELLEWSAATGPFIFSDELHVKPESKPAIVASENGEHSAASRFHSTRFPIIRVSCYGIDEMSVGRVLHEVDVVMHRHWGGLEQWGSVRVLDSFRMRGFATGDVPWWHGSYGFSDYAVLYA